MTIGERIRRMRESLGWTQEDLADAAQLNRVTVAKYESGTVEPKSKTLAKLAAALGVKSTALLGEGDDMTEEEREVWEAREAARRDPERRLLFNLAKNGSADDIRRAVAILDALKATNPDFYDGDDPS